MTIHKTLKRALLLAPVVAVTAGLGLGTNYLGQTQVPSTLTDFFGPGTQPSTLSSGIVPSQACTGCHAYYDFESEPYRHWVSSMMGQSSRDPMFYACLAIANQDAANSGELCLRCHTPGAWLAGRSEPTDGSALDASQGDLDGVTCNFCHRLVDPVPDAENPAADGAILAAIGATQPNPHTAQYHVDPNDVRRGPFDLGPTFFWHAWAESPFHQDSALCGTCHDVSNPMYERVGDDYVLTPLNQEHPTHDKFDEFPVERTYSEWLASDFAERPQDMGDRFGGNKSEVASCQDCHMPDYSGSACAPALNGEFRDDLPQHHFNGANTWVLSAIRSLYPDNETGLAQSLVDGAQARTLRMLFNASDMQTFERDGQLVVRVINNSGHKLPTGYLEGRRAWINVKYFDAGDNLILEHGAYNPMTAVLSTSDTKVYEAKHGIDAAVAATTGLPEGESFHFVLNNVVEKDNRIPPRGFTNAAFEAFQSEPVAYAYDEEQYWDDTEFDIPPGAVKVGVFLRYQITSREYIEFLRDENTTNSAGQTAYDQWELHGKSAPVALDRNLVFLADANCAEPIPYGLAKESTIGTFPELSADTVPSESNGTLTLRVRNAIPNTTGVLIVSTAPASVPFMGGKRFVSNPFMRLGNFGIGANGEGTVTIPIQAGSSGTRLFYQAFTRDVLDPTGFAITNGLRVDFCD